MVQQCGNCLNGPTIPATISVLEQQIHSWSLLLAGLELLLALGAVDNERACFLMLDHAGANELLHHVGGQLAGLGVLLELHDLLL